MGSFISPSGNGTHTVSFGDGNIHAIAVRTLDQDFTVNIEQTVSFAPVTVILGSFNEVVNVSPGAHNLNNIEGDITTFYHSRFIGDNNGSVNIYDQANTANHTFSLDGNGILSRSGAARIHFDSVSSITINAGNGNNTFNVSGLQNYALTTLNTGNGHDTVNVDSTGNNGVLTINEGTGGVDVNVGATVHQLFGTIIVNGGTLGVDNLVLDDTADTTDRTYTVRTNGIDVGIAPFSPASIAYNSLISSVTLEGGTGVDTFNVKGTRAPMTLIANGHATVNLGDNGSVQQIAYDLTISDPPSFATVNVDDSADATAHNVTLGTVTIGGASFGSITGLAPGAIRYKYADTNTVTVQTGGFGGGGATVNLLATAVPVSFIGHALTTLNIGNAGGVQAINGSITITNPPSVTAVNVDDSADTTVRTVSLDTVNLGGANYGRITGLGSAPIQYKYADTSSVTVQTGTGPATVNVLATGKPVNLIGHSLNTAVNIGFGSVQAINGPVTITNPPSFTTVNVDDSADSTPRNVSLDTVTIGTQIFGRITGLAPADILYKYSDTNTVTVQTGSGGATVNAVTTGKPVNLFGNPGAPISLAASDAANTWTITGHDAGTLSSAFLAGTINFNWVKNLTGGNGADSFLFADGAGIDGTIDGGAGTNTLDYSTYSSTVFVDLQTGSATGVGTGVANIQNVTGGSGGGAGLYNILVGNGGNVLTGGDGRRNLLIAGASASTLIGGNDDDILIGGTTAYDTEAGLVSLQAIMNYWSSTTDDYATRVANLLSGNGVPLLDATMVHDNGGGNALTGNHGGAAEMNLFYGVDPTLETTDYNPAIGEQFVNC
jgi:hypothetical protein